MRYRTLILFAALFVGLSVGTSQATILCNGDSNTAASPLPDDVRWCERLGVLIGDDVINRGVGGSAIVSKQHAYWYGSPMWGDFYIDAEIVDVDPFWFWSHGASTYLGRPTYSPLPKFDTVILAWGTNDLNAYRYTPGEVIKAIKKARRKFAAYGAKVYVATVPAIYELDGTKAALDVTIQQLNRKIRGNFPKTYVEFYEGFTWADYSDRLHLNAQGHEKRALAALEALTR